MNTYTSDEIIAAAEQELDAWRGADFKNRSNFDYEKLGFISAVLNRVTNNKDREERKYTSYQLFAMATNVAEWAATNPEKAGKQTMEEWREFYDEYFLKGFTDGINKCPKLIIDADCFK